MDDETLVLPSGRRLDAEELNRRAESRTRVEEVEDRIGLCQKRNDPRFVASSFEDQETQQLLQAIRALRKATVPTLRPILPAVFSLKGRPYTLDDYAPFQPMFRTDMPQAMMLMTGRQVSKSTTLAARMLLMCACVPYYSILFVTPLFEMSRRFSHNYVREFIEGSPIKPLLVGAGTTNSVLQRSFFNGSTMYFSYAFLDAERTRGIPADENDIDEIQDMRYEFLQIIHETMSGSGWSIKRFAGTPKSLDNTANKVFGATSQAEYVIRCRHGGCNHWNIPAHDHDLLDMIGPWHSDISPTNPAIVCAKCRKPLDPKIPGMARWRHAFPERRRTFVGYHVPQTIMPMHYGNPKKWRILLNKMEGKDNTSFSTFLNEVCGVATDVGTKVVSQTDLMRAANLGWKRKFSEALKRRNQYRTCILSVDWGGGGGRLSGTKKKGSGDEMRQRTSFTTLSLLGMKHNGRLDCLWGYRSTRTHDPLWEAQLCVEILSRAKCQFLVHDYGGAGDVREALIVLQGFPAERILGVRYHGAASHNIVVKHPPTDDHPRSWYSMDKSRSLGLTCEAIKYGLLRFFEYDYVDADQPGVLHDFLALNAEKVTSARTTDLYMIASNPDTSDDFAQATNIGCCMLWHLHNNWPDIATAAGVPVDLSRFKYLLPKKIDWDEVD